MTLLLQLKELCDPPVDDQTDRQRVENFVRVGKQAIIAFETISNACIQLNDHIETLIELHKDEIKLHERKTSTLEKELRILKKLDKEANDVLTEPLKMRTNYTGEFPYHGWQGIGRALEEALDQRDMYRATLEEVQEEFALRQPNMFAIKAMVRGVLKMSHRKEDA